MVTLGVRILVRNSQLLLILGEYHGGLLSSLKGYGMVYPQWPQLHLDGKSPAGRHGKKTGLTGGKGFKGQGLLEYCWRRLEMGKGGLCGRHIPLCKVVLRHYMELKRQLRRLKST